MADRAHQARRRRGPLVDRARTELAAGRPWIARAQLHSLLQRDPGHDEGRALLVSTLREMGDKHGARLVAGRVMHGPVLRQEETTETLTGWVRTWAWIKNAVATAVATVAITLVVAILAAPFVLFGIGLYQVGDWVGLW